MASRVSWTDAASYGEYPAAAIAASAGAALLFHESRFVIISASLITSVAVSSLMGLGICYIAHSDSKDTFNKKATHSMTLGAQAGIGIWIFAAFFVHVVAFSNKLHEQRMQCLNLEKEIALQGELRKLREENNALINRCKTMHPTLF